MSKSRDNLEEEISQYPPFDDEWVPVQYKDLRKLLDDIKRVLVELENPNHSSGQKITLIKAILEGKV
jgi:hypothetical protein